MPIRSTVVTLFAGRSVCVFAFVFLLLGQVVVTFFADLGFRGVPLGHIKSTWNPKVATLVPHLAGAGPRDTFLVNLGCILGAILDTILHTGGHLWQLFASFWYPFFSDVFGTVSGTCPGRANVVKTL